MNRSPICVAMLSLALSGCGEKQSTPPGPADAGPKPPAQAEIWPERPAQAPVELNPSFTDAERADFYHLSQGAELVPLAWLYALNNPDGTPFIQSLARYGFLPDERSERNPYGLPVGMTIVKAEELAPLNVEFIGFNCAACHVSEIRYQDKAYRVLGGAALLDFIEFGKGMRAGLMDAVSTPPKLWEFFVRVQAVTAQLARAKPQSDGGPKIPEGIKDLHQKATQKLMDAYPTLERLKAGSDLHKAMASEFEAIARKLHEDMAQVEAEVDPGKLKAHVAARFTPKKDESTLGKTLDGIASKIPLEEVKELKNALADLSNKVHFFKARLALLKRSSQVKGTPGLRGRVDAFGRFRTLAITGGAPEVQQPATAPLRFPPLWGFDKLLWLHAESNTNSVVERNIGQALALGVLVNPDDASSTLIIQNINQHEVLSRKINTPRWPAAFPPIDDAKRAKGEGIYKSLCAGCHERFTLVDNLQDRPLFTVEEIGTDPSNALNFIKPLPPPTEGSPYTTTVFVDAMSALLKNIKEKAYERARIPPEVQKEWESGRTVKFRQTGKYWARPLEGIWANPPFLHNGAVPTLDALLRPSSQRPAKFKYGDGAYDPVKVGYVDSGPSELDTSLDGNSNRGHEGKKFGTELSDDDRAALLEYLKSK